MIGFDGVAVCKLFGRVMIADQKREIGKSEHMNQLWEKECLCQGPGIDLISFTGGVESHMMATVSVTHASEKKNPPGRTPPRSSKS